MAKETNGKEHPVSDALKRLKDEEFELVTKLKPIQEAITALEKIVDKTFKKTKSSLKDNNDVAILEEVSEDLN